MNKSKEKERKEERKEERKKERETAYGVVVQHVFKTRNACQFLSFGLKTVWRGSYELSLFVYAFFIFAERK